MNRRTLLAALGAAPLLALPGCATTGLGALGGLDPTAAIRRLLALSSQRAFARLLQPNGFFEDQIARVELPPELGGGAAASIASAALATPAIRDRLLRQVNKAAESGAQRAAPLVTQAISSLTIADAVSVVRGGREAATQLLQARVGDELVAAMLPQVGEGLRLFDSGIVTQVLQLASGIDFGTLRDDVARKASDGIFRAIGREEAAIRADPGSTGDPLLIALFSVLR